MPTEVKPPLTLAILGAECTGKTTLAKTLAYRWKCHWLTEPARHLTETLGRSMTWDDIPTLAEHLRQGRDALRQALRHSTERLIILDTCPWLSQIVCQAYYGRLHPALDGFVLDYDAIVITDLAGVRWQQEPFQRSCPQIRRKTQRLLIQALKVTNRDYCLVKGPLSRRIKQVSAYLESWRTVP